MLGERYGQGDVMSFILSTRSLRRLKGVESDLVRVVVLGLRYSPIDFAVTEGLRDIERQRILMADGFSKTLKSKHLVGRAVDIVAVGDLDGDGDADAQDRLRMWEPEIYRPIAAAMKRAAADLDVSIRWGGDFKNFFDGVHFELV